jgi:predicted ATPase
MRKRADQMRINWLKIYDDRNLRNFEIDFDETVPITVLLGRNGSGKSNLIENIVEIFLALEEAAPVSRFSYEMEYFCYGHKINVETSSVREKNKISLRVDGKVISQAKFKKFSREYLPSHIFAYYSGWNNRLEKLFAAPTKKYYRANLENQDSNVARRFFFCRKDYANLALLALFFETHELAKYIRRELLGIEEFESALMVMRAPWWARTGKGDENDDEEFFWGARGNFTEFMSRLRESSLTPIRNVEMTENDIRGRTQNVERLYLYIRDEEHLNKLRAPYESPKLLFNHLESMYLSDLIDEIRVVGRKKDGQLVRFDQLSEGEQQLVAVFGLLLFTQTDESLYLLDEPDSHLNPKWTYEYRDLLRRALYPNFKPAANDAQETDPIDIGSSPKMAGNSQVLIATHNPLMVSAHPKTHVRVLGNEDGVTTAHAPDDEPPGMSIDRLLTSDVFGLRTALPKSTLNNIAERERLAALPARTVDEEQDLRRLSEELEDVGLLRTFRLPEEMEFIETMRRRENRALKDLTPAEIEERNRRADAVLEQILTQNT